MRTTLRTLFATLVVALLAGSGRAEPPEREGRGPPVPAGVVVHRDLAYAEVDGTTLLLDLYLPEEPDAPPALLVWIHGGGWRAGSRRGCPIRWLVPEGFAVASIDYRLSHQATFPAQIHDCKGALRWLRAQAETYGYDATRIGVGGSSAGGHLVALLGTSGGVGAVEGDVGGNLDRSSRVQAVYDLYGPTDLRAMPSREIGTRVRQGPVSLLLGGPPSEQEELARQASPVSFVSSDDPPFLIVHGERDPVVPVEQSQRLHGLLQAAGVDSTLEVLEGAAHGGPAYHAPERRAALKAFFLRHVKNVEVPPEDVATTPTEPALPEVAGPGPHRVGRRRFLLRDEERAKDLPLAVTYPRSDGPHAVIVFSHGAYGSRDGYRPLADHWASHGYVVIQPTHEDSLALGGRLDSSAFLYWASRPADVSFVLDRLDLVREHLPDGVGTLDAERIGVGGHSFGAHTAMLLGGATTRGGADDERASHADARPKAFLLVSPQGRGDLLDESSWETLVRPAMVITGTNDTGRGGQPFTWRTEPYLFAPEGDKYLALLVGAHHGFGGIAGRLRFPGSGPARPRHVEAVRSLGLLFFDAYVRGDEAARAALTANRMAASFPDLVRLTSK